MSVTLSFRNDERAVLAHVVVDPDAWLSHAVATFGEDRAAIALIEKVSRWRPEYEAAKAAEGRDYKPRAQREAA